MFCLDYAIAFFAHTFLCKLSLKDSSHASGNPLVSFGFGGIAGTAAAVALYPFDIVRQTTVKTGTSHFAFSTIPFMSVYIGVYFSRKVKKEESFSTKICWATGATTSAAVCELPFDKSKISISGGSMRTAAVTTAMRVPLGALLLVAYDHILHAKG